MPLILPGIIAGAHAELRHGHQRTVVVACALCRQDGDDAGAHLHRRSIDGDYGTAAALSTVLLVLSGSAIYLAFRLMGRDERALL